MSAGYEVWKEKSLFEKDLKIELNQRLKNQGLWVMGINSNKKKSDFLGMSHSKAAHKLRKLVLFQLVQQSKRDACFRCGQKICSVDELSIEHKEPWEGRSVELFWDLANIAFSHMKCNRPHSHVYNELSGIKQRKVGPEGTAWCNGHQHFLPIENFTKRSDRWNKVEWYCKECRPNFR